MLEFASVFKIEGNFYEHEAIASNRTVVQLIAHFHVMWIEYLQAVINDRLWHIANGEIPFVIFFTMFVYGLLNHVFYGEFKKIHLHLRNNDNVVILC